MTTLTDRVNGHYLKVSGPPMHTFRDSGVTVKLRKLSPMTGQRVAEQVEREKADTKPQPPLVEVDYGNGTIKETNKADPVYQRRLAEWQAEVSAEANERFFKFAALLAVDASLSPDDYKHIAHTKRLLKITTGVEWRDDPELSDAENAQLFYMTHIACGSKEDLLEFYQAVAARSTPTEAAIERHKETFPGDVSGAVDLGL